MGMPAVPSSVTTLDEFFALPEDNARHHELLDGTYIVSPEPSLRQQRGKHAGMASAGQPGRPPRTGAVPDPRRHRPGSAHRCRARPVRDTVPDVVRSAVARPRPTASGRPDTILQHCGEGSRGQAADASTGSYPRVLDHRPRLAAGGALPARRRQAGNLARPADVAGTELEGAVRDRSPWILFRGPRSLELPGLRSASPRETATLIHVRAVRPHDGARLMVHKDLR